MHVQNKQGYFIYLSHFLQILSLDTFSSVIKLYPHDCDNSYCPEVLDSVSLTWRKVSTNLSYLFQVVEELPVSKNKRLGLFHKSWAKVMESLLGYHLPSVTPGQIHWQRWRLPALARKGWVVLLLTGELTRQVILGVLLWLHTRRGLSTWMDIHHCLFSSFQIWTILCSTSYLSCKLSFM